MIECCRAMQPCCSSTRKTDVTSSGTEARHTFRDELLHSGLLLATGVPGVYGRSARFEDTVERVDRLVTATGANDGAQTVRFPPILNRKHFERSGYLDSFPQLAGAVHAFSGGEHAHRALLEAVAYGADWSAACPAADVVLTPAACYPVYPILSGTLPAGGRLIDVMSYCFRHEPSDDVARMQMFRMHEHVRAGDPEALAAWRNLWLERAQRLADSLGLDASCQVASDQFFGRGGRLLADSQRDRRLKIEIVAPIASDESPTAIVSLNDHQDHFGRVFDIATADGSVAHTSCVGFGLERIALALYRRHGLDRSAWATPVREALGL
jgi:seryl-tRNA synthetase